MIKCEEGAVTITGSKTSMIIELIALVYSLSNIFADEKDEKTERVMKKITDILVKEYLGTGGALIYELIKRTKRESGTDTDTKEEVSVSEEMVSGKVA